MKRTDRRLREEPTVAERQGSDCEVVAERSRRQIHDHRNTNRQRGWVRATSVRENAKSNPYKDASRRAGWREETVHVLTQGDLTRESGPGVSRGRSSVESWRKPEGAKGRRNHCKATQESVNRAQCVRTSAARSAPARNAVRTRNACLALSQASSSGSDTLVNTRHLRA
jgi:hypothetical protein